MPEIKQLLISIGTDNSKLDSGLADMNRKLDAAQRHINERYGAISNSIGSLGNALTIGITAPVLGVSALAVSAAADYEALENSLTALTGSSEEAARQLKRLRELAKLPGLTFDAAVKGTIQLQAVGIAANESERALRLWGNAIARAGKSSAELSSVFLQMSQSLGKGVLVSQDIRAILEAVPEMGKIMRETWGTVDLEAISSMGVDSAEFFEKIFEGLEKLDKVSVGAKQTFAQMQDELRFASKEIGEHLLPNVIKAAQSISGFAKSFSELPPWAQKSAVGVALFAAGIGPAINLVTKLSTAIKFLNTVRLLHAGTTAIDTATTAANTTTAGENTVATAADAVATQASSRANTSNTVTTGANTAVTIANTRAVQSNTAARAANAATAGAQTAATATANVAGTAARAISVVARLTRVLPFLGAVFSPIGIAALAAATGIAIFVKTVNKLRKAVDEDAASATAMGEKWEKRNAKERELKMKGKSIEEHDAQIRRLEAGIANAEKRREDAKARSAWWRPRNLIARSEVAAINEELKQKESELAQMKQLKSKEESRQTAAKTLNEEIQKTIQENELVNQTAKTELWIISAGTKNEQQKRQAWVDREQALAKIEDKVKEVYEKHKIVLDMTEQRALVNAKYAQAMKDIAESEADAARQENAAIQSTRLSLAAVNTQNKYHADRLVAQSQLVQSLATLTDSKSDQVKRELVLAQHAKTVRDINMREIEAARKYELDLSIATQKVEALRTGDKDRVEEVNALSAFATNYVSAVKEGGQLGIKQAELAYEEYIAAKRELENRKIEEAAQTAKTRKGHIYETKKLEAEQLELMAEDTGDKVLKEQALRMRREIEQSQFADALRDSASSEETSALKAQDKLNEMKYQSQLLDIRTGGLQAFADKARKWKDEEIQGWEDRRKAAEDYAQSLKSSVTSMGAADLWEKVSMGAIKAQLTVPPFAEPPPDNEISAADTLRYWDRQEQQNAEMIIEMRELNEKIKSLASGGSIL